MFLSHIFYEKVAPFKYSNSLVLDCASDCGGVVLRCLSSSPARLLTVVHSKNERVKYGEWVSLEFSFLSKINLPISRVIQVFTLRGSELFPLD